MHRHDIGMFQLAGEPRFLKKSLAQIFLGHNFVQNNFHGHGPLQITIPRPPNRAHPTPRHRLAQIVLRGFHENGVGVHCGQVRGTHDRECFRLDIHLDVAQSNRLPRQLGRHPPQPCRIQKCPTGTAQVFNLNGIFQHRQPGVLRGNAGQIHLNQTGRITPDQVLPSLINRVAPNCLIPLPDSDGRTHKYWSG